VEILEISEKFQGNLRNSINYNNNHKHIDPKPWSERCGNFREISEIQSIIIIMIHISTLTLGRNYVEILEISEIQSIIIIIINISTLTLGLKDVEISEKFQKFNQL